MNFRLPINPECLFGKAPFASKSFRELGEKIWDEKPVEVILVMCLRDMNKKKSKGGTFARILIIAVKLIWKL